MRTENPQLIKEFIPPGEKSFPGVEYAVEGDRVPLLLNVQFDRYQHAKVVATCLHYFAKH